MSRIEYLINNDRLIDCMKYGDLIPINAFRVNGDYIIGVYKGSITEYDVLIKYRQRINNKWSRVRTPKHIHWTVDILMKIQHMPDKTREFLEFLLREWETIETLQSDEHRQQRTSIDYLLLQIQGQLEEFQALSQKGEYSIKFLILLAKLLMIQEKTNRHDAYMFKNLLTALHNGQNIFDIVSKATHNGK